jgi:hypothetical protein
MTFQGVPCIKDRVWRASATPATDLGRVFAIELVLADTVGESLVVRSWRQGFASRLEILVRIAYSHTYQSFKYKVMLHLRNSMA